MNWLKLFSYRELKTLLSGAEGAEVDTEDLRRHTVIDRRGVFTTHRVITWFWQVVSEMTSVQRSLLLRFVTACSSPPLMGFAELTPPFTIRLVDLNTDSKTQSRQNSSRGLFSRLFGGSATEGQLPTSATCFNMLKLPVYSSKRALAAKLLMAIEAKAGFDLQ